MRAYIIRTMSLVTVEHQTSIMQSNHINRACIIWTMLAREKNVLILDLAKFKIGVRIKFVYTSLHKQTVEIDFLLYADH